MVAMRTQRRGYATWPSMAWGMLYGGALALIYAIVVGKPLRFEWTVSYLSSLIYLAIFGSIVTFACYLTLLKRIGAARSSYVGVMVPVVALMVSVFFEGFQWTWMTSVGVLLSIGGNVLMLQGSQSTGVTSVPQPDTSR
jgi:drug/metabolite transporter (DMT)-like permease